MDADFDFAGVEFGIDIITPADDFSAYGNDVFFSQGSGGFGGFGIGIDVESALSESASVSKIDEDEIIAMISIVIYPSGEDDFFSDVAGTQGSAVTRSFVVGDGHCCTPEGNPGI